jgi:hypothetical protein
MLDSSDVIRRIAWRDLFPWLILLRTFRIAISPAHLAVASVAVLLAPLGWWIAALLFQPEFIEQPARNLRLAIPGSENSRLAQDLPAAARAWLPSARTAILDAYYDFAEPVARLFLLRTTVRETAYYALGTLWLLVVWSFPAGLITRRAVVDLATDSPTGVVEAARFAGRRFHWYLLAPLYPLIGVLVLAAGIALIGLPIRWLPGAGSVLAGLLWIFVVLAGLAALWLLGGLLFGFPLMWPTISAERDGDAFEAFSRSYSYVYSRPLYYFFYVVVAALFGALCWAVVTGAGVIVREFGFWALSWGGTAAHVAPLREAALRFAAGLPAAPDSGTAFSFGATLIGLAVAAIHAVVTAFRYSFFFAAASAIYLLLRQDADEKELDEVYQEAAGPAPAPPAASLPQGAPAQAATTQPGEGASISAGGEMED